MDEKRTETNHELLHLAGKVLAHYGFAPEKLSIIQSGTVKTVWRFQSAGREYCLKRLKQTLDKATFSVHAQRHIHRSGGLVPEVIPDTGGQPLVAFQDQLFTVYEWIDGRDLNFGVRSDLHAALQGLAAFHRASRGYLPPEAARTSSKLGKWPDQYLSMQNKLTAWREASEKSAGAFYEAYSRNIGAILDMAARARELLTGSAYDVLTAPDSQAIVLCHQDYGKGNALLTPQGTFVLDLDGVTFDLPARDLRKIIGKQAEQNSIWDREEILDILRTYGKVNPLSDPEVKVLLIDLLFPHWFYGLVKNAFLNQKPVKASEVERTARLEQSKLPVLQGLLEKPCR